MLFRSEKISLDTGKLAPVGILCIISTSDEFVDCAAPGAWREPLLDDSAPTRPGAEIGSAWLRADFPLGRSVTHSHSRGGGTS